MITNDILMVGVNHTPALDVYAPVLFVVLRLNPWHLATINTNVLVVRSTNTQY